MFKAYQETPHSDWTDGLLKKGIPIAGAVIGGALGAIAGPEGIAPGMQIGSGIGNMVGGMVVEDPNSEAKMAKGLETGLKGYKEWQQLPPKKNLDTDEKGKIPGLPTGDSLVKIPTITPSSFSSPENPDEEFGAQAFKSTRAPMFAKGSLY
jgi:hypothetical protein